MADQDLQIKITTTADTAGVQQAATALQSLDKGAQAAGPAVASAAAGVQKVSEAAAPAAVQTEKLGQIFGGLARSTAGGKESIMGVAMALRALWTTFTVGAGPVGIVLALCAALAGLVLAFKSTGESAEQMQQKIEAANKVKLDRLAGELKSITDESGRAKAALDAQAASAERIADAKLADQLAANKASGLPAKEIAKREVDIRRNREDENRAAKQKLLDDKSGVDSGSSQDAERERLKAQAQLDVAEAAKGRLELAKKTLESTPKIRESNGMTRGLADNSAHDAAEAEVAAAQKAIKAITQPGEKIEDRLATLTKARDATREAKAAADNTAEQSRLAADNERASQSGENPYLKSTRATEDKGTKLTPAEEQARDKRAGEFSKIGSAALRNRFAALANDNKTPSLADQRAAFQAFPDAGFKFGPAGLSSASTKATGSSATLTRGGEAYQGGEGGIKKVGESMDKTTKALQTSAKTDLPDFEPAAKAAQDLTALLATFATTTSGQLLKQAGAMQATAGAVTAHDSKIKTLAQRMAQIEAQMASIRSRSSS